MALSTARHSSLLWPRFRNTSTIALAFFTTRPLSNFKLLWLHQSFQRHRFCPPRPSRISGPPCALGGTPVSLSVFCGHSSSLTAFARSSFPRGTRRFCGWWWSQRAAGGTGFKVLPASGNQAPPGCAPASIESRKAPMLSAISTHFRPVNDTGGMGETSPMIISVFVPEPASPAMSS